MTAPVATARGCDITDCGAPARPYAGGWRCDDHAPGPAIAVVDAARHEAWQALVAAQRAERP